MHFEPSGTSQFNEAGLAKHLISDVRKVFSTMVGMHDIFPLPLMTSLANNSKDCVTAMIGLAGAYNGVVSLHASRGLAIDITAGMRGMQLAGLDEDIYDAMGELANMIAGAFKNHLSSGGADIRISLPSIMTGKKFIISTHEPNYTMSLGFATAQDSFLISAVLNKDH